MFSTFGKRALVINASVCVVGGLEILGYYYILPEVIRKNFEATSLPEKPNYSKPVVISQDEGKFVFAHRGGKTAAEAVINDTFTNSKLMKRAVLCQVLTSISLTAGYAKSRRYMLPVSIIGILTNLSLAYPTVHSAVNLLHLSRMVKEGDEMVWENLNEARYAQRMIEYFDPIFVHCKNVGMFGSLAVMLYCTPFLGSLVWVVGKVFSIHRRLQ